MSISPRLVGAALLTTALSSPTLAYANALQEQTPVAEPTQPDASQADAVPAAPAQAEPAAQEPVAAEEEQVDISVPGGEIVVTGRRDRNLEKASQQVISVLSSAEIARTG